MSSIFRTIALELGRTLLKLAVDRALRKKLPAIFAKLDIELPSMLVDHAKPLEVQAVVTDVIEEKIGGIATATQVSAVLGLYDHPANFPGSVVPDGATSFQSLWRPSCPQQDRRCYRCFTGFHGSAPPPCSTRPPSPANSTPWCWPAAPSSRATCRFRGAS